MTESATPLVRRLTVAAVVVFVALCAACVDDSTSSWTVSTTVDGPALVFSGIPEAGGWGESLVSPAANRHIETLKPCLGGIPVVDVWTDHGGVAIFNLAPHHEAFEVQIVVDGDRVTLRARGGSDLELFEHQGDYYEALREFAVRMAARGVAVREAPEWAFLPVWETYGFEESWSPSKVETLLPTLKSLGIGTITLDSGWYGTGTRDWEAGTGDFEVNEDVIGSDEELESFVAMLHREGFRVRLWWTPGVAERETTFHLEHPELFAAKVTPSWGEASETGDYYLDPTNPEVVAWTRELVDRFVGYGVDGFKQDDVYEIDSDDPEDHAAYSALFADIYETACARKSDFTINTCNCGIAQNFYDFPGENMLITSDPVGAAQFRQRAKVLHALNVGGAAILGDHVELSRGDVGPSELGEPSFYRGLTDADFASTVALGMVLETKLTTTDPGELYRRWFGIYRDYEFFDMEWINVPRGPSAELETYLMRGDSGLFYSLFTPDGGSFSGTVELPFVEPDTDYAVYDITGDDELDSVHTTGALAVVHVEFLGSLVLWLEPQ